MESFTVELEEGAVTTGLLSLPSGRASCLHNYLPLIICLHGGSYDAKYFDCDSDHSIATVASALAIPIISVTRPGYGDSTGLPPQTSKEVSDLTYAERQGRYINSTILPALWKKYGSQTGATAVVLLAHSIGAMMAIIAAGSHTGSEGYPLAGMIVSGIGSEHEAVSHKAILGILSSKPDTVNLDPGLKDALMLQLPVKNLTNPSMQDHTARLNKPIPFGEIYDINVTWLNHWHKYTKAIRIPLMYAISEVDGLWSSTPKALQNFRDAFPSSPRIEAAMLPNAPHCIELSRQSRGWLTRCCGFALESASQKWLSENA